MKTLTQSNTKPDSVLRVLRDLMPQRVLSYAEALQRAEMQASRLLSLQQVSGPDVPAEVVTELRRLRVVHAPDLPVSGSAHWDGYAWVISLNANDYEQRRRFSLMHEFKHVLDHPTRHLIQGDRRLTMSAEQMAEKVADYFAACVLMPRVWVKDAFCNRSVQNTTNLARLFRVSPSAMNFRLAQLGLTGPARRCSPTVQPTRGAP